MRRQLTSKAGEEIKDVGTNDAFRAALPVVTMDDVIGPELFDDGVIEIVVEAINNKLDRGVTYLKGQGFYSKQDFQIVYCVVSRNEMQQMKKLINQVDPFAFTTITEAHKITQVLRRQRYILTSVSRIYVKRL